MPPTKREAKCRHSSLYTDVPAQAYTSAPFRRPSESKRLDLVALSGKAPANAQVPPASSFPGPIITPGDALTIECEDESDPQSLYEYARGTWANAVTRRRRILYVVDVPGVTEEVDFMNAWTQPSVPEDEESQPPRSSIGVNRPRTEDVAAYLEAFYGLPVRVLRDYFSFVPWSSKSRASNMKKKKDTEDYVGLAFSGVMKNVNAGNVPLTSDQNRPSCTRIRHRPSQDGVTAGQLNLSDLLDGLIPVIPSDAYAIALLTNHDLYEDDDDDFCCGRAFGASRVCVVSTFRYNPILAPFAGIDSEHCWPVSHCKAYVDALWDCVDGTEETESGKKSKGKGKAKPSCSSQAYTPTVISVISNSKAKVPNGPRATPLGKAVLASARGSITAPKTKGAGADSWLARVCQTTSHELGHNFGVGHCGAYACVMQSTSSVAEDTQQPPYLCPVCLAIVAFAVVGREVAGSRVAGKEEMRRQAEDRWIRERYVALRDFCGRRDGNGLFRAFGAWIEGRQDEMGAVAAGGLGDDEDVMEVDGE